MEKFKILNKASGSKDFTQSAQKQFDDTMKIINEMMELFELLSHTTMNPSNLDKLSQMFDKNNDSLNDMKISRELYTNTKNNEFNEIFGDYIDSI